MRLPAASASSAAQSTPSAPATPVRSMALTSRCEASHGATSAVRAVMMLTTPPGTSDVASTSPKVMAGSGRSADVTTTAVLPVAMTGATTETSPSSEEACGASTPTTPVGSGAETLK